MQCWIYKGKKRAETYLYLGAQDDTDSVPDDLLKAMGPLELVMELDLSGPKHLARANPKEVSEQIQARGYYLQLPPVENPIPGRLQ